MAESLLFLTDNAGTQHRHPDVSQNKEFRLRNLSAKRGRFSDNFLIARVRILSEAFLLHRNAVSYAIKKGYNHWLYPEIFMLRTII